MTNVYGLHVAKDRQIKKIMANAVRGPTQPAQK